MEHRCGRQSRVLTALKCNFYVFIDQNCLGGSLFVLDGVEISYKHAYVTRAQELKSWNLNWEEFDDE